MASFRIICILTGCIALASVTASWGQAKTLEQLQQEYLAMKWGLFLHFNMSTFSRQPYTSAATEWELGTEDPNLFNPSNLDCGQWMRVAKSAGMNYAILVVKHHGGFCLWNSKYSDHSVAFSTWRNGKGDVVREFVDSARAYGLEVGLYYSMWDKSQGCNDTRCDTNFVKGQLTELLTNYGPLRCLWFDGWGWWVKYNQVPFEMVRNLTHSLQPDCLVIDNNHHHNMTQTEMMEYERPVDGNVPLGNTIPAELNGNIRSDQCWFYHPVGNCALFSAQSVVNDLQTFNSRTANFLFDLTPDDRGLIPDCQVDLMNQIGQLLGIPVRQPAAQRRAASMFNVNYNPSNGSAVIGYTLREARRVDMIVFDQRGRRVAEIASGVIPAGRHTAVWNACRASAGAYVCRATLDGRETWTGRIFIGK
jgi:alpha-L-fucosidase